MLWRACLWHLRELSEEAHVDGEARVLAVGDAGHEGHLERAEQRQAGAGTQLACGAGEGDEEGDEEEDEEEEEVRWEKVGSCTVVVVVVVRWTVCAAAWCAGHHSHMRRDWSGLHMCVVRGVCCVVSTCGGQR